MSAVVPSWADIRASWSAGWRALSRRSLEAYEAAVRSNPLVYADRVSAFVAALTAARQNLDAIAAKLPDPPSTEADRKAVADYRSMEQRYHALAAGFYADALPAGGPVMGVAPVVVVAGLAVGAAAVSWAIAAYEYAVNLREQTALADRELTARVEASRAGRSLAPSTLPAPPSPVAGAKGAGLWLLGGLAVAAGALTVPLLLRK